MRHRSLYRQWPQRNTVTIAASGQFGFMPLMFFSLAENPVASTNALASTSKGLFRSTDSGATWTPLAATGLLATELTGLAFSSAVSGRVFAGDRAGHFYCSNDGGNTWILPKQFLGLRRSLDQ
jgi:photosystem II stability/assembly factor-like uncharacterized protein